tara:strand:- start:67 stop:1047 length:981 start_codon:yes stop_codon:yes gene_type:complete
MAIKSSGSPNPPLSFTEIEAEFGANGTRSLGAYRITQNVGSLSNLPLDSGIPTSGQIKFSDFYSKRLNVVVDCHSGGDETRTIAKNDKWNNNQLTVIGGFRSQKEGGSKIIINVNKKICSDKSATENCALKTGSWDATAVVQVDVGSSGQILGSGGNGGNGQNGIDGGLTGGGTGSSGLGIEVDNTTVNIASGGIIRAGFGGGGGGGGSRQVDKGEDRRASGGGGGGGAGCPPGAGGSGGSTGAGGESGDAGDETTGGSGGSGGNAGGGQAIGGTGGSGGQAQGGPGGGQGGAGANGAAIRRTSGFTVNINNSGTVTGDTSATGVG